MPMDSWQEILLIYSVTIASIVEFKPARWYNEYPPWLWNCESHACCTYCFLLLQLKQQRYGCVIRWSLRTVRRSLLPIRAVYTSFPPMEGGGFARPVTSGESYASCPVWSPDSKTLAYASDRYGNFDIFTVPASGGVPTRITANSAQETPFAFSNDGRSIYFGATICFWIFFLSLYFQWCFFSTVPPHV